MVQSRPFSICKALVNKGDKGLYEFILNRGDKKVNNLLTLVCEMEVANEKQERAPLIRLALLRGQLYNLCVCNGEWLECALEILGKMEVMVLFAGAVVTSLALGHCKGHNIYITGLANCGKTFILNPMRIVFTTFLLAARCSYAWLGVEDKEVIFSDDFRWSPLMITCSDMLSLLESLVVHFTTPKTSYSEDIYLSRDTPVF